MNEESLSYVDNEKMPVGFSKILFCIFKRFIDLLFSVLALFPFFLITIIVKILYMLSGDFHPIFYTHKRVGKFGKNFRLIKYRTMVVNSDEVLQKMLKQKKYQKEWKEFHKFDDDPRITKVGKILRKCSIDELPQIINIIKGDMSIIGPRPLIEEEVLEYKDNREKLLSIKPGLTGWWACNGRSCTNNEERMELELYYVDHFSFSLDIKCFFLTIIKVIKREGAK